MSVSRSRIHKLAAGLVAAGICATASLGAVAPSLAGAASAKLSGAAGQTAGTLVPANPALSAYWNKDASHAKSLESAVSVTSARAGVARVAERPQGPAGQVAGTTGALSSAPTARSDSPDLGPIGSPWWGSSTKAPATTTGKVFFTDHKGGNWVCSGSLVNSTAKNVVITAGHCVYGTAGGELPAGETWHSNWVFAPDYNNGNAPYGYWTARQLWTVTNYINNGDEQDDLGAAILNTNAKGQNAIALFGGQGFAWNQSSSQYIYAFGYPSKAPFNGQVMDECDGSVGYNSSIGLEALNCTFTAGSSGGPWLMSFNGEWGYIDSVVDTGGYSGLPNVIGGLYFGNNAENLYNTVANI